MIVSGFGYYMAARSSLFLDSLDLRMTRYDLLPPNISMPLRSVWKNLIPA